ncbi:hypothetical protein HU200_045687 [Digitaria exilis]|uniref:Uncharacterized protein n=1 Tax=Digitaria exilis TaxID=1010633 RepID=A0A835ED64_9POAL|nr:hypothetical protein HU200_045687 [Digitaria exilis]
MAPTSSPLPSLQLIPITPDIVVSDCEVALLRCRQQDRFYIALLHRAIDAGYPALSLHDPDVVYVMHTPDSNVYKASVIAIDMRNKTLKDVADFGSGRPLGYTFTYLQSGISKHLND